LPAEPTRKRVICGSKLRLRSPRFVGALDYLTSYPYGCTEQTMSSFLPNVVVAQALKDVPTAKIRAANDLNTKVSERHGPFVRVPAQRRRLGLVER